MNHNIKKGDYVMNNYIKEIELSEEEKKMVEAFVEKIDLTNKCNWEKLWIMIYLSGTCVKN